MQKTLNDSTAVCIRFIKVLFMSGIVSIGFNVPMFLCRVQSQLYSVSTDIKTLFSKTLQDL